MDQNGANATIIIPAISNPKCGTLFHNKEFNWAFKPGISQNNATVPPQDFYQNEYYLINNNNKNSRAPKIYRSHHCKKFKILQYNVSQHISDVSLRSLETPILLQTMKLSNHYKTLEKCIY